MSNKDPPYYKSNISIIYDFLTRYSNPYLNIYTQKFIGFIGHN
jgi:hypothetical protein